MPESEKNNALRLKLFGPLAESAGGTLRDIWELVFGNFGNYVEQKRLTRRKALEEFKASLENKVSAIPEERLCEPSLAIVGPALDASKYYFEEPKIREMFANLIASSLDSETADDVHPSFSEIIRQMSAHDAQNLVCFTRALPIAEYRIPMENSGYKTILTNVFLSNPAADDLEIQSQSISSLARLGLVSVSYSCWLTDEDKYADFDQTDYFLALTQALLEEEMNAPTYQKGIAELTPLGKQFKKVCLG